MEEAGKGSVGYKSMCVGIGLGWVVMYLFFTMCKQEGGPLVCDIEMADSQIDSP